jgi:transglutaminase-like putative cysteine protease
VAFLIAARAPAADKAEKTAGDKPKIRVFQIDYGATLKGLDEGAEVRVWLPVPQSNDHQQVKPLEASLPAEGKTSVELKYGNKILFFETKVPASGRLTFQTPYLVKRREVRTLEEDADGTTKLTEMQRKLFLSANEKVPLTGKPLYLLTDLALPADELALGRALYDRVDQHVRYDKSQPGYGQGDVLWVCDSRFGNCTDFHSLFIALARSQDLPARFEIGFPLPPERGKGSIGGYHCWALFYTDKRGWVPVDISEADKHPEMKEYYFGSLTEDRVTFSTGRDIDLLPKQSGPPLNFFIYPYVEVGGKPLAKDQMKLSFAYHDMKPKKN